MKSTKLGRTARLDWTSKEVLLILPAAGTALAVILDVGFFWGVSPRLFHIFSITEHITFALQAIPVGLTLAFLAALIAVNFRRSNKPTPSVAATTVGFILGTVIFGFLVQDEIVKLGWQDIAIFAAAALVSISIIIATFIAVTRPAFSGLSMYFLTLMTVLTTFTLGYVQGTKIFDARPEEFSEKILTKEGTRTGRVVRIGERGVLYFDVLTNRIVLSKWDQVDGISWPRPTYLSFRFFKQRD